MHRRTFLGLLALAAAGPGLAACGAGPASGSDTTILRLALNQTEKHPSYIALTNFSQRLEQATGGRYRIDVFANEVLGAQQEILNLMSSGIVDLAIISSPQLENLNKDFQVFNLPRVFDDVEHQMKVITDPAISGELFTSLEAGNGLTVLGGFTQGERNLYTKKAIRTPADLSGVKIRVQESPVMLGMIRAMGGSPTPMAYGEVYTALQAGVLDGAENNEVSYSTQKHSEVARIYTYTRHLVGLDYLVASTKTLQRMPADIRAAFDTAWQATWQEFLQLWDAATKEAIATATKTGATFAEIDTSPFDERLEKFATDLLSSDVQRQIYRKTREAATA